MDKDRLATGINPARISQLAEIGTLSTSRRGALKSSASGEYYYALDRLESVEEQYGACVESRTTLGMKVGRTALHSLQLIYIDGYQIGEGRMRTAYQFEWTPSEVLRASRRTSVTDRLGDSRYRPDLSVDMINTSSLDSRAVDLLGQADDYEQLNDADCKMLADRLQACYGALDMEQLNENSR